MKVPLYAFWSFLKTANVLELHAFYLDDCLEIVSKNISAFDGFHNNSCVGKQILNITALKEVFQEQVKSVSDRTERHILMMLLLQETKPFRAFRIIG